MILDLFSDKGNTSRSEPKKRSFLGFDEGELESRNRSFFNMDKKNKPEYPSVKTSENAEEFYESTYGEFGSFDEAADYYEDNRDK